VLIVSLVQGFSSQPGQDQWSIVVIHAGSFAILYVWIISAVFLSCIIGVSQSELAIPRILDRLQHDLEQRFEKDAAREMQRTSKTRPFSETYTICDTRICRGGIYSWRPDKWHRQSMHSISTLNVHPSFNYTLALHLVSMFLVTCTFLVSFFISALVPPEGFNCRHIAQIITLALWLLNSLTDPFLANYYFPTTATATSGSASGLYKALFRTSLIKDTLFATAGMIILILGQLGIYNRCTCWTQWGNAALVLPQLEGIAATVDSRLRVWWVLIALGLGLQVGFCGGCARMFWDAIKVYLMKDEGGVAEVRVARG
jgi:hypothetical protein